MEKFSTSIRGYKKEEVNKFVDDCINKVENMLNELKQKDLEIENTRRARTRRQLYEQAEKYM